MGGEGDGGEASPIQPFRQPSREEIYQQDIFNNFIVRSIISGIAGMGMGAFMGILLGGYDGSFLQSPEEIKKYEALSTRQKVLQSFKQTFSKSYSYAKSFGVMGALFAGSECLVEQHRAKSDMWNSVYAGCFTGAALSYQGGPKAMCVGCAGFAVFSAAIDRFLEGRH